MSAALATPMPSPKWSIGSQWIGAHVAAQAVCIGAAALTYGVATLIGANDPAAGAALKNVAYGLAITTELIYAFATAFLRGAVLRQAIPRFPLRLWVVVVVGYMMLMGLMTGFASSFAAPAASTAASTAPQATASMQMVGMLAAFVMAAIMGAIVGAIEALVIRRAAVGAGAWMVWMALAVSVGLTVLVASALLVSAQSATAMMVVVAATKLVYGAIVGVLTLPALKRLTPRTVA